ncbi:MAG: hypothetical protein KDK26_15115, partial [Roseivivax sp.]|nr:hypothetical protein [Roseivivax sp.]
DGSLLWREVVTTGRGKNCRKSESACDFRIHDRASSDLFPHRAVPGASLRAGPLETAARHWSEIGPMAGRFH